jgi:predicted transcriptional regulator
MGRPHAVAGETVELCRMNVSKRDADRLAQLAAQTGSSQSWHRRKALTEYLDRELPESE